MPVQSNLVKTLQTKSVKYSHYEAGTMIYFEIFPPAN